MVFGLKQSCDQQGPMALDAGYYRWRYQAGASRATWFLPVTNPTQARPALNRAMCLGSLSMTMSKSETAFMSITELYYSSFPTMSTPSSKETSTNTAPHLSSQATTSKPSPTSFPNMLWVHGAVSAKRWEPIWDLRTRPTNVQTTAMDLLRQLTELRRMPATLPSIDTLALPPLRQLRVAFGDMNALCDAIVSASLLSSGPTAEYHWY